MAVTVASAAIFSNNGQICCSGSRTFVHEDIYDEFVKKSVERAQKGVQGDPSNIQTKFGPQVCLACSFYSSNMLVSKLLCYREKQVKLKFA